MRSLRLKSGRQVAIRPIRPDDGPELQAAYDRLSTRSKYLRFLAPKPHLNCKETRYLVEIDGRDHVALVATPAEHPERIIAVARFVRLREDPRCAEFAIVVGDEFQHQGLGAELMRLLAAIAAERGIDAFRATVLAENTAVRALVHGLPGELVRERRQGAVDELEIQLAA